MIEELTLLHAHHTPRCIATVDKVFGYHTIQLMTRGKVELSYDQQRHELAGRWYWPCFPGPRIRFHESPRGRPWEHRYVAFTGPLVRRWEAQGIFPRLPLPLAVDDANWLAARYDEMLRQMNRPGRWGQARASNLLESMLLYLAERSLTVRPHPPAWLLAVSRKLEQLDAKPDYHGLAAQHNLSLTTLRRQFREATGTTLHQYRLDWLITEARNRLGNTNRPIKEIAEELGYQDVYYFTRQFTQAVGVSPRRFRRSRQT